MQLDKSEPDLKKESTCASLCGELFSDKNKTTALEYCACEATVINLDAFTDLCERNKHHLYLQSHPTPSLPLQSLETLPGKYRA